MKLYAQLSKDLSKVESVRHISDGLIEQYTKLKQFAEQKPPFIKRLLPVVDAGPRPAEPHDEKLTIEPTRVIRSFPVKPVEKAGEKAGAGESGKEPAPISETPSPNSDPAPAAA